MNVDYSKLDEYLVNVQAQMKPYQVRTVSHGKKNITCVVDSKGGSGKSLMGLTMSFLRKPRRILILCTSNALFTWEKEAQKWYPEYAKKEMFQVVTKDYDATERKALWKKDVLFTITTWQMFVRDFRTIVELGMAHWDVI